MEGTRAVQVLHDIHAKAEREQVKSRHANDNRKINNGYINDEAPNLSILMICSQRNLISENPIDFCFDEIVKSCIANRSLLVQYEMRCSIFRIKIYPVPLILAKIGQINHLIGT